MMFGTGAARIAKEVDEEEREQSEDDRGDGVLEEQRQSRKDQNRDQEQPSLGRPRHFLHRRDGSAKPEPMERNLAFPLQAAANAPLSVVESWQAECYNFRRRYFEGG